MLIDKFDPLWLAQLAEREAHLPVGARQYLLIDGVFLPGIHRRLEAAVKADAIGLLFELLPGCSDESRAVSPLLVHYQPNNAALEAVLGTCSGWPMVSVIVTSEPIDQLVARLAGWCIIEADEQYFNFRFPDTRRLPTILEVLSDEQKGRMLGSARELLYIERNGKWKTVSLNLEASDSTETPRLSERQFGALVQDGEADSIIELLRQRGDEIVAVPSVKFDRVQAALVAADHGKLDDSTRLDWCAYCLQRPTFEAAELRREWAQWHAKRAE